MAGKMYGFHCFAMNKGDLESYVELAERFLIPMGYNTFVLELNNSFRFKSHPEVAEPKTDIEPEDVAAAADKLRSLGAEFIPLYNCLGHQGWRAKRNSLLKAYPEFDETPEVPDDDSNPAKIYTPAWCANEPKVYDIVLPLIDEMIEASKCKIIHLGMDEVFSMANCPRCKDIDRAVLFSDVVTKLHDHVAKKGVKMMIWGDRLLDSKLVGHEWEGDKYGTWPAVDMIPKDVIIADWHYDHEEFPSVNLLRDKGLSVWPATYDRMKSSRAMAKYLPVCSEGRDDADKMLGMLVTCWAPISHVLIKALENPEDTSINERITNMKTAIVEMAECFPKL